MPTVISLPEKKRLVDGASGRAGSACRHDTRDSTTNERAATLICHERREIESNDA